MMYEPPKSDEAPQQFTLRSPLFQQFFTHHSSAPSHGVLGDSWVFRRTPPIHLHHAVNICIFYVWLDGGGLNKPSVYWKGFPSRRLDKIETCLCRRFTDRWNVDRPHGMAPARQHESICMRLWNCIYCLLCRIWNGLWEGKKITYGWKLTNSFSCLAIGINNYLLIIFHISWWKYEL